MHSSGIFLTQDDSFEYSKGGIVRPLHPNVSESTPASNLAYVKTSEFLQLLAVPESFSRSGKLNSLACRFHTTSYCDSRFQDFAVAFPKALNKALPKRKAEYLAGRFLAGQLLQAKGASSHLGTGQHRSPDWPDNIVGSITHTDSLAICVVAWASELLSVGIDAEPIMTQTVIESVAQNVMNGQESALISSCGLAADLAFTLLFSAKESLFKALYPFVRAYFDFDAARLVGFDPNRQQVCLALCQSLHPYFPVGSLFYLDWVLFDHTVVTVLEVPQQP